MIEHHLNRSPIPDSWLHVYFRESVKVHGLE
jgi:hypothetical protein